jgi:hypothetical protein
VDFQATAMDLLQGRTDLFAERPASQRWAVIAGALFFLFDTVLMVIGFTRGVGTGSLVLIIFIWLVSLAVLGVLGLRTAPGLFAKIPRFRLVRTETGPRSDGNDAIAR